LVKNYENRRGEETGEKGTLFSEDGGPLTDNVVLSSDQRVLVLKRTAVSKFEIPCRGITGLHAKNGTDHT